MKGFDLRCQRYVDRIKQTKGESLLSEQILRLGRKELMKIFVSRFATLTMLLLVTLCATSYRPAFAQENDPDPIPHVEATPIPNSPEVTISFPNEKYFIGTQQSADITITGPDAAAGTYSVHVTGPGTDTTVSLRIGGEPGGNKGSATVNIPSVTGNATYTAKVTIKDTPVEDSARVEAAQIKLKITQSDATPNPAKVGDQVDMSLGATAEIPSFGVPLTSGPTYDWEFVSVRYRSSATEAWSDFYGLNAEITWYPSESTASYEHVFDQAGEYEIKVKATVSVVVNGQTYSNSEPATAYIGK